jgi:NAD(P)-dependent dehydrogenase (short-subunit alcohol dehydrogenase family)
MDVAGHPAIVTGGASGLGAAVARRLATEGAAVTVLDRDGAGARAVADEIGGRAREVDVADADALAGAFDAVGPLRALVCCAALNRSAPVVSEAGPHGMDLFDAVVRCNLGGSFHAAALAASAMAQLDPLTEDGLRGVLVLTASVAGLEGRAGQAAYAASKAGIVGLTLPLARELGPLGIRVMTVAPGPFDTPMVGDPGPMVAQAPFPRRPGRPEEFADLVLSVIRNDMLNGSVVRLDGGIRMGLPAPAGAAR